MLFLIPRSLYLLFPNPWSRIYKPKSSWYSKLWITCNLPPSLNPSFPPTVIPIHLFSFFSPLPLLFFVPSFSLFIIFSPSFPCPLHTLTTSHILFYSFICTFTCTLPFISSLSDLAHYFPSLLFSSSTHLFSVLPFLFQNFFPSSLISFNDWHPVKF